MKFTFIHTQMLVYLHVNKLIFGVKDFAKSRFETEVKGNSEMPGLLMVSLRGHVTTKSPWIADTTFF